LAKTLIPEKHYIGLAVSKQHQLPIAIITPWGKDATSVKRMKTVDSTVKTFPKSLPAITVDNQSMIGFRFTPIVRRSQYGGSDKWMIEDPRGFFVEIDSDNVAELMITGSVENGQILSSCIWARASGKNVLLCVDGDRHLEAIAAQDEELSEKTSSDILKNLGVGQVVIMNNGNESTYLGKVHRIVDQPFDPNEPANNKFVASKVAQHAFWIQSASTTWSSRITQELCFITSPKIKSVETNKTSGILSPQEGEKKINELLFDQSCYVRSTLYSDVYVAAANTIKENSWSFQVFDESNVKNPWDQEFYDRTMLIQTTSGVWGTVVKDGDGLLSSKNKKIQLFEVELLQQGIFAPVCHMKLGSKQSKPETILIDKSLISKICGINLLYTTKLGNNFTVRI
jgi:hypothetical protein